MNKNQYLQIILNLIPIWAVTCFVAFWMGWFAVLATMGMLTLYYYGYSDKSKNVWNKKSY